jgi:uncharacterized protein (TIGR02001 family)
MPKLPQALLLAGLLATPLAGLAQATSPHSFSGKVALYSEYEYRGISQTAEDPALQLTLDYAHSSGFYLGTFVTNIRWLDELGKVASPPFDPNAPIELDIYGGYKFEVAKDVTLDVGYLRYQYPGANEFVPKPNTDEVYVGLAWGPVSVKYSYAFSDLFGVPDSDGSDFIEANVAWPVLEKLTLNGHIGHQRVKRSGALSYTVWKLGATYDFGGGFNAGAYVKGTDADEALYTVRGKDLGKERLVAFVSYSF